MTQHVLRNVLLFLQSRSWPQDILDISIVAFLSYRLLMLVRGTRAVQLSVGLGVLVLVGVMARILNLQLTYYIFSNLAPALLIGVVILFQAEIRRALDRVGRVGFLGRPLAHYNLQLMSRVVDEVVSGTRSLAETRTGALIVFERSVGLENYALTGVRLGADVTSELLLTIFFPRSPLHDGATIIRGNKMIAAGCLLPVSDELNISGRIGTRHRAALALSMESDALVIVVSEESGRISVVQDGTLHRGVEAEALRQILHNELVPKQDVAFRGLFQARRGTPREPTIIPAAQPDLVRANGPADIPPPEVPALAPETRVAHESAP